MRHFRATKGLNGIKHSSTLVANTGQGVATFFTHVVFITDVGTRNLAGGVRNIKDIATTGNTVNVGDMIKYVNICLECCPRGANPTNDNDNCAWLEWAVVWQRERDVQPTVANIGVGQLSELCTNLYRENCFLTGCFPIGTKQAMSQDIKIKIPRRCCKIKMGDVLEIICFVRTSNSTDTRTDSHRLIASSLFKVYS